MSEREVERWITVNGVHVPLFKGESEDDVKSRLESFTGKKEEPKRALTSEEKIYNELGIPVPKKSSENIFSQRKELQDKIDNLESELEKERIPDNDPELAQLPKIYRDMFAKYTPKGEQIKKDIANLRNQRDELESKLSKRRAESDKHDREEYKKEVVVWNQNRPELKEIGSKDYKGFSLDTKTGTMQNALEKGNAIIVEMSPKEYMQRISYDVFKSSLERGSRGVIMSNVEKYATEMKNGTKYDLPWIDYKNGGQEGRHRAMAAILNGYKTIPVAVRLR